MSHDSWLMTHEWRWIHVREFLVRVELAKELCNSQKFLLYSLTNLCKMCKDKLVIKNLICSLSLSLLASGLRSKCSICSRRFESRRWFARPFERIFGYWPASSEFTRMWPVSRIVSALQCRWDWSTPVFFGKREPIYHLKTNMKFLFCLAHTHARSERKLFLCTQSRIKLYDNNIKNFYSCSNWFYYRSSHTRKNMLME